MKNSASSKLKQTNKQTIKKRKKDREYALLPIFCHQILFVEQPLLLSYSISISLSCLLFSFPPLLLVSFTSLLLFSFISRLLFSFIPLLLFSMTYFSPSALQKRTIVTFFNGALSYRTS